MTKTELDLLKELVKVLAQNELRAMLPEIKKQVMVEVKKQLLSENRVSSIPASKQMPVKKPLQKASKNPMLNELITSTGRVFGEKLESSYKAPQLPVQAKNEKEAVVLEAMFKSLPNMPSIEPIDDDIDDYDWEKDI